MSVDAPLPFYLSGHGIIRCDMSTSLDNVRLFDQGFSRNFFSEMTKLLLDGRFADITLKTGSKELRCHRCVLSAASPYFAAMFSSGMDESRADVVEIHGTDPATMEIIIKYIYSAKIELDTCNVQSLVQACDLFQFEGLKFACEKFLYDQMDTTNCIGFYKFAKLYNLQKLQDGALCIMMTKFKDVVHGPEFAHLSTDDLVTYIGRDELQVTCEDPVFDAVSQWLSEDPDARGPEFERIVPHIRLPYCTSAYLCHVVQQTPSMRAEACSHLVDEARDFQLQPEHQTQVTSRRTKPRLSFNSGNSLVLVGGLNHENHKNKHCWYLSQNAAKDSYEWQLLAQLPCPKSSFYSICVTSNGIMLTGGYHGTVKQECWLFDVREKKWKPLPSMLRARCKHTSLVHGDYVYVIGGEDDQDQPLSSVERFDLRSCRWEALAAMEDALTDPPAAAYGRYIYVMGGLLGTESQTRTTSVRVQMYDTVWGEWQRGADMPAPCRLGTAAVFNHRIYILGGYTQSCMSFDPRTQEWKTLTPPKQKHGNAAAVVWGNSVLLAGGDVDSNQTTSVIEEYDPRADRWSFSSLSLKEELACHFLLSVNLCSL